MDVQKRIKWIDGVKGISCIFILVHHYFLAKFPACYFGDSRESLCNGIDVFLSQSVLSFFMTGNFFVHLYVLITGYVVTLQVKKMQDKVYKFIPFTVKRYIKLSFPLLSYCLIVWILCFFFKVGDPAEISLVKAFKEGLVKILFLGSVKFGGHFWMLNYIFLGGFAVSLFAANSWHFNDRKMILLSFAVIFCILIHRNIISIIYATCFSGALLYFVINEVQNLSFKFKKVLFVCMFLLSIFLGAYPTGVVPTNYYRFLLLPHETGLTPFVWHYAAAFLFFLSISQLDLLKRGFELKPVQWMANYSFCFYILHGYGNSIAIYIGKLLRTKFSLGYVSVSILCLPVAIILSFLMALVFQKFIVTPFNSRVNALYSRQQANAGESGAMKQTEN